MLKALSSIVFIGLFLIGCSNGSSSSNSNSSASSSSSSSSSTSSSGSGSETKENSVNLSGDDLVELSQQLNFNYVIYRDATTSPAETLIVTSDAVTMDINRSIRGELDQEQVILRPTTEPAIGLTLQPGGVFLNITRDGRTWIYEASCSDFDLQPTPCANFTIDAEAQSLTVANLELEPDTSSEATSALTLNGLLTWRDQDEENSGLAFSRDIDDIAGSEDGVDLAYLQGVWDFTQVDADSLEDVTYISFEEGKAYEYDYQGDSFDDYANCYEIVEYDVEDLGEGVFNFKEVGEAFAIIQVLIESTETDSLVITDPLRQTEGDRTSLEVADFVPECEF